MKSALQSYGNTLHYLYTKLKFTGLRRNNTHIRIEAKVFFLIKKNTSTGKYITHKRKAAEEIPHHCTKRLILLVRASIHR